MRRVSGRRKTKHGSEDKKQAAESQRPTQALPIGNGADAVGSQRAEASPEVINKSLARASNASWIQFRQHRSEQGKETGPKNPTRGPISSKAVLV